jgi:hypothetical protein
VPGNGSTHLYNAAIKTLLTDKDVMLVPVPSYGFFLEPLQLAHTHVRPIRLRPEDNFKLTPDYLDAELTHINEELAASGKKITAMLNINPQDVSNQPSNERKPGVPLSQDGFDALEYRERHRDGHYVLLEAVGSSRVDDPSVRQMIVSWWPSGSSSPPFG